MEIRRKKVKNIIKSNNKGSTMVETLVAFVVLFMVLASLYSIVAFSSELYMKSVDSSRLQQRFYREIYKSSTALENSELVEKKEYIRGFGGVKEGKEHASLLLKLEIDENNFHGNTDMLNAEIGLTQIGVTTYTCKDGVAADGVVTPEVVNFYYESK